LGWLVEWLSCTAETGGKEQLCVYMCQQRVVDSLQLSSAATCSAISNQETP
jgi:hypothetical protein